MTEWLPKPEHLKRAEQMMTALEQLAGSWRESGVAIEIINATDENLAVGGMAAQMAEEEGDLELAGVEYDEAHDAEVRSASETDVHVSLCSPDERRLQEAFAAFSSFNPQPYGGVIDHLLEPYRVPKPRPPLPPISEESRDWCATVFMRVVED